MRPLILSMMAAAVLGAAFSAAHAQNAASSSPPAPDRGAGGKTGLAGTPTAPEPGAQGGADKTNPDGVGNFGAGLDRGVGSGAGSTGMRGPAK